MFKLAVSGIFVTLSVMGETAKGSKDIAFETYDGDDEFKIALSSKFVKDALKNIDTSSVKIGINGAMNPVLFTPVKEEVDHVQMVLPISTYK